MNMITLRGQTAIRAMSSTMDFPPANQLEHLEVAVARALEGQDLDLLLSSLRRLCGAYGMTAVAADLGVERTSLYRMLRNGNNPKVGNVLRLLDLFQIRVTAKARLKPE